jgi:hypothetical protein
MATSEYSLKNLHNLDASSTLGNRNRGWLMLDGLTNRVPCLAKKNGHHPQEALQVKPNKLIATK